MNKFKLSLICFTLSTLALKFFIKWRYKRKLKTLEEDDINYHFYHQCKFTSIKYNCRSHLMNASECGEDCAVVIEKELTSLVSSAKISICICMYILTLKNVIFAMIKASKRGVKVRVITDNVMLKTDAMQKNFVRLDANGE